MGGLRWLGKQSAGDRGSSFKHFPVTRALRLDNNVMTGPLMGRGGEVQLMSSQLQVIARPEQVAPVSWLWMKSHFLFFPILILHNLVNLSEELRALLRMPSRVILVGGNLVSDSDFRLCHKH